MAGEECFPVSDFLSASRRTQRLTLPALHNRDTTKLIDLVTARDFAECDLVAYYNGLRPPFVFAVIQSVARRLGQRWSRDELGFAELSVILSRLHELIQLTSAQFERPKNTSSLALLVQPFDDHLLGAVLLDARLRYAGYATHFFPSWSGESLSGFDGILVTVSNSDRVPELSEFLLRIRRAAGTTMPLIVGGPGVTAARSPAEADLVTSSLVDAVSFCERRLAAE
jgi:hypothetical protein